MTKGYYTVLSGRAGVRVGGPDAKAFLQSMVTQDVDLLPVQPLLYSLMLTAQGKVHFDFFMWNQPDSILLETEASRAEDLLARLRMFTLRKDVTLAVEPLRVIVVWNTSEAMKEPDPRSAALGYRTLEPIPDDFEQKHETSYLKFCMTHAIPNGSRDIAWESDTVADLGLDYAVSYSKGCYLGQELTSRMHHRGLSKRGLYTVEIIGEAPRPFSDLLADGNLIGEMRSSIDGLGLALLRHDSLDQVAKVGLIVEVRA